MFQSLKTNVKAAALLALGACGGASNEPSEALPPPQFGALEIPARVGSKAIIFRDLEGGLQLDTWTDLKAFGVGRVPLASPMQREIPQIEPIQYQIKRGDTLSAIAAAYYNDSNLWEEIAAANPKINPKNLKIGATISVPAKEVVQAERALQSWKEQERRLQSLPTSIECRAGESLGSVAIRAYGDPRAWTYIVALNPDHDPRKFYLEESCKLRIRPEYGEGFIFNPASIESARSRPVSTITPAPDALEKQVNFIRKFSALAAQIERDTGIPALLVLAQAAAESGWDLSPEGNNFHGLKDISGEFMRFDTPEEGFRAYADRLCSARYWRAHQCVDLASWLNQIVEAGYCPDQGYCNLVLGTSKKMLVVNS